MIFFIPGFLQGSCKSCYGLLVVSRTWRLGGKACLLIRKHDHFTPTREIKRHVRALARNHPEGWKLQRHISLTTTNYLTYRIETGFGRGALCFVLHTHRLSLLPRHRRNRRHMVRFWLCVVPALDHSSVGEGRHCTWRPCWYWKRLSH